jgi:NADPH-dependent 2,4-dienoyl-CoA reductase/sulfur reductase-like enzyme
MSDGIVIAGGGLAAQRCVETLRRSGYDGPIRMVCGEAHAPYDRPPLSKAVLADAGAEEGPRRGTRTARSSCSSECRQRSLTASSGS